MIEAISELLKPRTLFAFMFYSAFVSIILAGKEVPPELNTIISALMGYWFGNRGRKEEQKDGNT
jgi:hypothetical protein